MQAFLLGEIPEAAGFWPVNLYGIRAPCGSLPDD